MKEIEAQFAERFAHWGIVLPADNVSQRQRGKILEAGWSIWYLFDADETGEYLDYYYSGHFNPNSPSINIAYYS